jgi:hypothetical protein
MQLLTFGLRIPRIQGGQECTFSAIASLTTSVTNRQVWARPPIDVDFQVLMFTSSGLIVRFLKVFEKSNYQSVKWVRYLTKASGGYQIRVSVIFAFLILGVKLPDLMSLRASFEVAVIGLFSIFISWITGGYCTLLSLRTSMIHN